MAAYSLLRYKNFQFPYNPSTFSVQGEKQLFHQFAPGMGSVVTDLGRTARTVTGQGEFFGSQAREQFEALWSVFLEKEDGILALPATQPFYAFFSSLVLTGEAGADVLRYQFTFVESDRSLSQAYGENSQVTAQAGQTVWHLAQQTGVTVEQLYQENPALYAGGLQEGAQVKLG